MFGTIIIESYTKEEAKDIALAIDDICSPSDTYCFASAGIYCFWDYDSKVVLYLGLAVDLSLRFKQHNGLIKCNPSGCKVEQIEEYFRTHDRIGYSILVQSPMSQPITARNKEVINNFANEWTSQEGKDTIRHMEGLLIESTAIVEGTMPPWNKVGGSISGQKAASEDTYSFIDDFTNNSVSYFVARRTLRELSQDGKVAWFENCLHGVRMMMLQGMPFSKAYELQERFQKGSFGLDIYKMMREEGYLNSLPELP